MFCDAATQLAFLYESVMQFFGYRAPEQYIKNGFFPIADVQIPVFRVRERPKRTLRTGSV